MAEQAVALGVELSDEDWLGYDRILETEKSQRRLYRIAKHFLLNQSKNVPENAQVPSAPKIYDNHVYDAMVSTYSLIAELIGDTVDAETPANRATSRILIISFNCLRRMLH